MSLFDAAADRLSRDRQAAFDAAIQSTRAGYVFAHNHKAFTAWARKRPAKQSQSLTGDALEQAVRHIGQLFPENVVYG